MLVEEQESVLTKYYKYLSHADGIAEVRAQLGKNNFRLLGFEHQDVFVVLTNGFKKKDQKVPKKEITLAKKRRALDHVFDADYDTGYEEFKIGAVLRQARIEAGMTQEVLAKQLNTKKSAISRTENHAQDIKLSTFAKTIGKELRIALV